MANALAKLFGASDSKQNYGGGMAEIASNTISDANAYKKYMIDTQTAGEEPMSKEEWARSRNG